MVVHLHKQLVDPPQWTEVAGVDVRQMAVPEDIAAWLALRERAVADLSPSPRPWLHEDYAAEMSSRPWWHAQRNWLAIADDLRVAGDEIQAGIEFAPARRSSPAADKSSDEAVVGAVTLAVREGATSRAAVVHWLLVDPAWRRRGMGRALMSRLEREAWDAGFREVQLETHANWAAAVAFYQSMGYAPVRAPSPR